MPIPKAHEPRSVEGFECCTYDVLNENHNAMAEELAYKRKRRLRGKNRKVCGSMVYDYTNLFSAQKEARKGKDTLRRRHKGVRLFDEKQDYFLQHIQNDIRNMSYHTSTPNCCEQLCPCGKVRMLTKLPFNPDHIVHHALMRVVYPTMKRYYYYDSYASIKGKGMHFAKRRVERFIDENKDAGRLYWIKRDFVKFYHNIHQDKMYVFLCRLFTDKVVRNLFYEVTTVCEQGLGIGLYPIQPIVNLYTCDMCRTIMRECNGVRVFVYCDDILVIGRTKQEVWKANAIIERFANDVFQQPLHEKYGMQIVDEKCFCDFVGFRFFFGRTFIRKAMARKFRKAMRKLKDPLRRFQVATSYKGWLMHCDGYNYWRRIMAMKSFKELKVPKFDDVDSEGKRMLKGQRISASILVGREITFVDCEIGVRSKFTKNGKEKKSTLILVEEHGQRFKFFTDNQKLIQTMEYIKENGMFPFRGTLVNVNMGGGLPDYEIQ